MKYKMRSEEGVQTKDKVNKQEPRKQDPSYDYISLGQRIQDQMESNGGNQTGQRKPHVKNSSMQPTIQRGRMSSREQLMTPTNMMHDQNRNQVALAQLQVTASQSTQFENYLSKVIKSVERRKKKSVGGQNQTQRLAALMDLDYSSTQNLPSKPLQQFSNLSMNNTTTFNNFSNQIVPSGPQQVKALQQQTHIFDLTKAPQSTQGNHKNQQIAIIEESKDDSNSLIIRKDTGEQKVKNLKKQETGNTENNYQVAKDKIFIPLEKSTDVSSGYMFQEMKNPPENHAGIMVFSKQGIVTVGKERNQTSDFISNEEFIHDGVNRYLLKDIPFFRKFQAMRIFKQWKYIMRWNAYSRKRQQLSENLHFAKPVFAERYDPLVTKINQIRTLPFMEIKKNTIYGKKQQSMLDDRCSDKLGQSKQEFEGLLKKIKDTLLSLKQEILDDDKNFESAVKESRVQALIKMKKYGEELVMFSKARRQKELEEEQFRIQKLRHQLFDKFIEMILKFVANNLVEALYVNKKEFKEIFKDPKGGPQFEVAICFNPKGKLDTDPSMEDHYASFLLIFENMEKAIYQNQSLIEFIGDLVSMFFKEKNIYYKHMFESMKKTLNDNKMHKSNNDIIFNSLKKDIERCRDYLGQFISLQEIYDFAKDWENNRRDRQISLEMGFYKETWMQMDKYGQMIEKIPPGNTKLGTILVETLSLKKYLSELPKKVIDSIRHNVTLTMENETKSLREELSKTSEILDQLPTSLNVNLPKLQKTAAEGLNQNKDTMEKIMQSSSLVLSKKIKAFEKKYVETYLQDRSRIEDCADTLEELFKRSKAIHEIRSKVILYKEFLKLLYEDDPNKDEKLKQNKLQCTDDYEFVQDLHKETIKLWKMLLYWRKRRQMCYNTPFLQLDTNKIIRSINKVNKYFEEKLSKNEFLKDKSRPLCKVVILQVKETSLIIEFLKELRKESLQQRHWVQIFNLIKAPHLKNSNNFTIVNLREYHIQNYREEIQQIIEHANTELKYEKIFKSIKEEWEQLELKIIPYKETMDSYILVNTDTLSNAIEENLTTLETISSSKYAIHVKQDILDWIKTLKLMLKNLEIWVNAQKHWINLDPIFQSTQLEDILGQDTNEFQELRNQFKRIMWSTFKNPKATYNLMINNRIEIFENLIKHFSVLQKKVHEYLEQRRLSFPRFFFLNDSQFLDFLTLANSNQDFNDYVNVIFQGAQKLYINKILSDKNNLISMDDLIGDALQAIQEEIPTKHKNMFNLEVTQSSPDERTKTPYLNTAAKDMNKTTKKQQSGTYNYYNQTIEDDASPQDSIREDTDEENFSSPGRFNEANVTGEGSVQFGDEGPKLGKLQKNKNNDNNTFQVLGMISFNKELFLFERPVKMENGVEHWLVKVEESMQETIAKMINYAVSSFPNQSLDEWILDYPQQVIITTIHLILSHEINELLEDMNQSKSQKKEEDDEENDDENNEAISDTVSVQGGHTPLGALKERLQSKRSNMSSGGHKTFSKRSKDELDEEDQAMKEYLKKKNELRAQQQADEEEEKRRQQEEMRQRIEANEIPRDPEKEKRKFIDDMFGKDFPLNSNMFIEEEKPKNNNEDDDFAAPPKQPSKIEKKPEFKDLVMGLLQKKSFQGLYLRLQFWINQILKSLFSMSGSMNKEESNIKLHSVQIMVMKTIVAFLLFQRDIVDNLIKKNIRDVNDFEWQSQIRLLWTGIEPGCRVDCGGWSTYQQNEYLGSQPRLTLTPLTNRYFIFISAALREKSGVLLKCAPSHQIAGDVFEEFSNICSVPFRKFQCNSIVQMKSLMQYLNGAALASVWVFFEHLDKLPFIQLQTFNKKIQMIQQQFIIAELSGQDGGSGGSQIGGAKVSLMEIDKSGNQRMVQKDMKIVENTNNKLDSNQFYGDASQSNQKIVSKLTSMRQDQTQKPEASKFSSVNNNSTVNKETISPPKKQPFTKASKVCFGVFGSISHSFIINHNQVSEGLLQHVQSAFRVLALTRPNELQVLRILLKAEGFTSYENLSQETFKFIEEFYRKRQELLFQNKLKESFNAQLNLKDIKIAVKIACILRDVDLKAFNNKLIQQKSTTTRRVLLGQTKSKEQKIAELQLEDIEKERNEEENKKIESKSLQLGIKLTFKQKFTGEWIDIFKSKQAKDQAFDQIKIEEEFNLTLDSCLSSSFRVPLATQKSNTVLSEEQLALIRGGVNLRKKSITNSDVLDYFQAQTGSKTFIYQLNRLEQDKILLETIAKTADEVINKMNYAKANAQLRNCIKMIEYIRHQRGIVMVGPSCSGKTSILKIVSNILQLGFNIKMRTSVVNPVTFTPNELYGEITSFNNKSENQDNSVSSFNKGGIFQIILDVFEKERQTIGQKEKGRIIQSIFIDSSFVDSTLTECLLGFLQTSNKRQEDNSSSHEVLLDLLQKDSEQEMTGLNNNNRDEDHIPVTLPNNNVLMFPTDLYLFFETPSLKDASRAFIEKVGIIVTEEDDIGWKDINIRQQQIFIKKHKKFFEEQKLYPEKHIKDCFEEFLEPFIDKFEQNPKVQQWQYYNSKACVLQYYNLLNATFIRFAEVLLERQQDDSNINLIQECQRDVFWSSMLQCIIWSFGAVLNKELRKLFEELFFNYRRKFNINIGGPGRQRFTLFDIYYDPENITWDLLQEKLEYKLKLQYDPVNNILLIPCVEVSQSYFMMDMILGSMRADDSLDKNFRVVGPSGTSKSIALTTFAKRYNDQYNSVIVPMSSYLIISKLKQTIESYYTPRRRNLLEPKEKDKRVILIIDDLHLQANLKIDVLEFLRTWCMSKGYYDVSKGYFKNIGNFGTIMAENSEYRNSYCKVQGKEHLQSRFLFQSNTLYIEEYDLERYKLFVQHWLTSKMWNTSKLINKYYILITNSVIALLEKMKRQEYFHNTSLLKLTSFHLFARFCSNLANYTLISDEPKEITVPGQKEEDSAANMMVYEILRSYGDRIMMPNHRTSFIQRVLDCCKQEFVSGTHLNPQYVDSMLLGNYHERRSGAHIKYLNMNNDFKNVKEEVRQKIRKCSNNHFLETFLDAPNGLKEIFRLSRILFKEMQNVILIGQPGCGKHEYLQLAAILNDALIFELNCPKFGQPVKFASYFKQAILSAVNLNQQSFIVINDSQVRDNTYIDFVYNYMVNLCYKENTILMDDEFRQALIDIELEIQRLSNRTKTVEPNNEILFLQALRKIQKNVHIVILISEHQTYFEWVTLFPGLETKCEVIYMEDLNNEGYRQLTAEFFVVRDSDNSLLTDQNLMKSLVQMRSITKNKILSTFYSQQMLTYSKAEDYMVTQNAEYIFNNDQKLHGFLYSDGFFQIFDPMFKQLNYNMSVEVCSVYKTKYIQFIELFRFLYDFLSLNLVIRRNYFETFLRKSSEFADFFKDIKSTKTVLHNESHSITYKLASLKDKIQKIQQMITDKEQNISRRQKDIGDLELELKNNKDELNQVIREKDQMIEEILDHLEKINGSEFSYIISAQGFKQNEQNLLDIMAVIMGQDARIKGYIKSEFDVYFLNREELINLLDNRRNHEYDSGCFTKLKDFISLYTSNDFKEKPLFKQLFNYLMELYRKLNVKNTMANTFARIKEIKEQIDSHYFSINYSKQFIDDKKEEMDGLKSKFERIQDQEQSLSRRIEEAEISHMRTEHIFEQIEKYQNKIYGKLIDVKKRIETLVGDCVILAATVVYLGPFSIRERMQTRKEMYDYIFNGCGIKCSPCWNETNPSLTNHFKLFKQVLKEYGLRKAILPHNISGILSTHTLIETIFTLIFAPSCPYIADPTGQIQEFIMEKLMEPHSTKKLFASDNGINAKLEQVFRSQNFALLNDLNDSSKDTYGLCMDETLLQRLSSITHNGYDFDYEKLQKLKQIHTLNAFHNSFSSVNKRIPTVGQYDNLSMYQVQIIQPRFDFQLSRDQMSRLTCIVGIDSDIDLSKSQVIQAAWIEIKELMLKHFLPDVYLQMTKLKDQIRQLDIKSSELNKNFENAFLVANQDTLQRINEYGMLKQSVEDIRRSQDEKITLKAKLQDLINDNALLSTYSNIISVMYSSLKLLSKMSSEVTYSWKIFLEIIDQVFSKVIRDLNNNGGGTNSNQLKQHEASNQSLGSQSVLKNSQNQLPAITTKEFTVDGDFFSTVIIPAIYGTVIAGVKQHFIPLYNLILSVKIAYKKKEITEMELEFFFKQMFQLKEFHKWRITEHEFIDLDAKVEKNKFFAFKREILKIYPEHGRKVMEYIDNQIGQTFQYKAASITLHGKAFTQNPDFKNLSLIQKINIGFLCPDHEFKSKICQLVYEQLSSIFSFNEELIKLHHFIKTASWSYPIALFAQNSINIINTVCSIASYYGVGLEVLRTDMPQQNLEYQTNNKNQNSELNNQIKQQLKDYNNINENNEATYSNRIKKEAVRYEGQTEMVFSSGCQPKINLDQVQLKDNLVIDEKNFGSSQVDQNPIKIIENCAIQGSWVFVSTLRFPSFWHKMCTMLTQMRQNNKISNTFRVFIDLQGYQQNEIPDSFLFDNSISFYLTDANNEDMEGFNDIWANILNDKILTELTQYDERSIHERTIAKEENEQLSMEDDSKAEEQKEINEMGKSKKSEEIHQDQFIKDQKQRELYIEYYKQSKIEESKNSNTLLFGSDLNDEIENQKTKMKQATQKDNMLDILSEIKSLRSMSPTNKGDNDDNNALWGEDDQKRYNEDPYSREQEQQQENRYSRINSINQSVEISKGENALIQELQSQFDHERQQIKSAVPARDYQMIIDENQEAEEQKEEEETTVRNFRKFDDSQENDYQNQKKDSNNNVVIYAQNDDELNQTNPFEVFKGDNEQIGDSQSKFDNTSDLANAKNDNEQL